MFDQISTLISTLRDAGALSDRKVVAALMNFARSVGDLDYRSHMLGELSVGLATVGEFEGAEEIGRLVENSGKSGFLRRVAEIEVKDDQVARALPLFSEARAAAFLHRFPAQKAMALAQIAESLGAAGKYAEADETWDSAVRLAMEAQHNGGTDGPEAAGVLVRSVEASCARGRIVAAKIVADSIIFGPLRDKALQTIADIAHT